jgi:predicted cupin superfamily sugar epimerase
MPTASDWIDHLHLEPHPEGGFYRERYRADLELGAGALPPAFDGPRNAAALIDFCLPGDAFSALHRIRQDELWHFLAGAPLTLHQITPGGDSHTQTLGPGLEAGMDLQAVVPAGHWFGATVADPDGYALVGCTTAPAFDFADFELADRDVLTAQFPQHRDLIERLTRPS